MAAENPEAVAEMPATIRFGSFLTEPEAASFIALTSPDPATGCWIWHGPIDSDGYGRFTVHGERLKAHRISYEQCIGSPGDKFVRHMCEVRRCVAPHHLILAAEKNTKRQPWRDI